jgi:hypothetical protein
VIPQRSRLLKFLFISGPLDRLKPIELKCHLQDGQVGLLKSIILATKEAEIRSIMTWDQPNQKVTSNKSQAWWSTPVIPATWGSINRKMVVKADMGIKWDLSKIIKSWRARIWLTWYRTPLSSNPRPDTTSHPTKRMDHHREFTHCRRH